jgi:protease-4
MAMSKGWKTFLIAGGILFTLILVTIIGFALFIESSGRPTVSTNSVLVLNVSGDLPDYVPEDQLARALGYRESMSFTALTAQLRKAKVDSRISAVFLDIQFPMMGWGKAEELRNAIADFKTSGKPVYAYMEIGSNKEYYIASVADKVFLPPGGDLYVNGFAAEAMFYRGSLDKLGIEPQFIQRGPKYKSAPDQYTKKEMGEGQREVINAVINEYYGKLAGAIAESRKKSPAEVEALINDAPYHAPEAKKLGLIDEAFYRDQVYDDLKAKLDYKAEDKIRLVSGSDYREIPSDSLGLNNGAKVAIIYASGAINLGRSANGGFGGQTVGSDTIVHAVNQAADDDSIKAIVLRVDSPGGSALASDLMYHAIDKAKAKKPVVVSMGDVAASGGYYISCNANKIVAESMTVTGSIGVFMGKPVVKGLYNWLGITNEYVMKGKNAGLFRETEKWTGDELQKMEDQADKIYKEDFLPKVAAGRGKDSNYIDSIGQGHVWTGTQAKENGLIDEIGGLEKAIEIAKQLANLPAEKDVKRVNLPQGKSFLDSWFESDDEAAIKTKQEEALLKALPDDTRKALRLVKMFDQMKKGEAMLIAPFELEIK